MSSEDLLNLSAVEALEAMRHGAISAEQYSLALIDRCERGKNLNAFITLDHERVLSAARAADKRRKSGAELGPLHGLPVPIKDSINTYDLRTTAGTPALRDFQPKEDAAIVHTLRNAGAIVLGKTNLHELSLGWTSNNQAFGAVRNPYDPARIPGGSSGGTAAAVSARMAPLGLAEDTEGSIRVPAALCGIAGFRPTTLRYPSSGTAPISALFDQVGPHARTVRDLALFDAVATGNFEPIQPATLKGLKLGVPRRYCFAGLDDEVARVTHTALRKLQHAGVELVEEEVPDLRNLIQRTTLPVQDHDIFRTLPQYLQESGARVTFDEVVERASPDVQAYFASCRIGGSCFVLEDVYAAARDSYLPQLRQKFREFFARTGVAAIVFPTTMIPATLIGDGEEMIVADRKISFLKAISRNISPGSTAGLPALVLPSGLTRNGLPVSLEFDAPSGADRSLLALGVSVEEVLGRLPPPALT